MAVFVKGQKYKASDYAKVLNCSIMSGMNYSKTTNTLVLILKNINNMYGDLWKDGILHYTGKGRRGDQKLTGSNKRLLNAKKDETIVYLFEVYKVGEYIYKGEVELVDAPYQVDEVDIDGNLRKVWKFPLRIK